MQSSDKSLVFFLSFASEIFTHCLSPREEAIKPSKRKVVVTCHWSPQFTAHFRNEETWKLVQSRRKGESALEEPLSNAENEEYRYFTEGAATRRNMKERFTRKPRQAWAKNRVAALARVLPENVENIMLARGCA